MSLLTETAAAHFRKFGSNTFMIHRFGDQSPLVSTFPSAVALVYRNELGLRRDPALRAALKAGRPVDVLEAFGSFNNQLSALRIVKLANACGIYGAIGFFVVPSFNRSYYVVLGFEQLIADTRDEWYFNIQHDVGVVVRRLNDLLPRPSGPNLTAREIDVLRHIAAGKSDKEIARALGLAPSTVRTLTARCYKKLNISSRPEAAIAATQRGMILPS